MKAVWFAVTIAVLGLTSPALGQTQSLDPQALALGVRYMAATGGMYDMIEQQVYVAAGIMGDTPTSHARQSALLAAVELHRDELAALDVKLASLLAETYSTQELQTAVAFLESPLGRSITQKKHSYFAAMFARDRPQLIFTPEESAALAAYDSTPEAISMRAKIPAILAQTMELSAPVQKAIRKSASTIFCHATGKCLPADGDFDQLRGPTMRERQ